MDHHVYYSGTQDCADMHSWGPGTRTYTVIHYILRGKGTFIRNGKRFTVTAGESFVMRPFETVRYYPDRDDPWMYTWVEFEHEHFLPFLNKIAFARDDCIIGFVESARIRPLFDMLCAAMPVQAKHAAYGLTLAVLGTYADLFPLAADSGDDTATAAVNVIRREFYKPDFGIAALCAALGTSRATLHRCFTKQYGTSPGAYLLQYRLTGARELLEHGQSVKATALSCGFRDPLYFSRLFKATTGASPTAYRKAHEN